MTVKAMAKSFDATKARWSQDADGVWLSLLVRNGPMAKQLCADWREGRTYTAEVKEQHNKRSLDANAYCWVLLDKLAVEISKDGPTKSPEEVYRDLIRDVGGNSKILPIRDDAIDTWKRIWGAGRIGWFCEDMGECANLPGYHNIRCIYGSSVYDTRQMHRLIELVVQECKQHNIQTATPEELARLECQWSEKHAVQ